MEYNIAKLWENTYRMPHLHGEYLILLFLIYLKVKQYILFHKIKISEEEEEEKHFDVILYSLSKL